jgi:adenosylcobinamide kinase / adenosylcobinamide-phosphate guanylyltransferase
MRLILVTGGARSGKSRYAEERAMQIGGDAVTYVATATAGDAEMAVRIERHRAARPGGWRTVETPRGVSGAVAAAETEVILLDCVTLLASNAALAAGEGESGPSEGSVLAAVAAEIDTLLTALHGRAGTLIAVTNEVGLGIVPPTDLGRWFRDALGTANCRLAAAASEVVLLVSGVPMTVKASAE